MFRPPKGMLIMALTACGSGMHAIAGTPVTKADWGAIAARDNRGTVLITTSWQEKAVEKDAAGMEQEKPVYKDGAGTGFVIDAKNRILTVAHIVPRSPVAGVLVTGFTEKWATDYPKQQFNLKVVALDRTADFAVLEPDNSAPILTPVPVRTSWSAKEGDYVHIRGFPLGVRLIGLGGEIAKTIMSDRIPTGVILQEGFSGGPIYADDGTVIGIARGGDPVANIKDPTVMGLGFFAPISLIEPRLSDSLRADLKTAMAATPATSAVTASNAEVRLGYQIDETKETLFSGLQDLAKPAETKTYSTGKIPAQPGYQIVHYNYIEHSAASVSNKKFIIAPDGSWMEMTYDLTSGPGWDRTRGWLEATLETIQKAR